MPQDDKDAATDRSKDKEVSGYLFDASQGSYMSVMKYCSDSLVRQHFYESRHKFGTQGKHNNKPLILETLSLREEKSQLLGFDNYAELSLMFKMAESPEQIIELF
jgi:oligopeptidase A